MPMVTEMSPPRRRYAQLPGAITVALPDSLDLLTPYVLEEQRDWFEDEIKFVRHLLRPGMKTVDVGANYGVYALTMADLVGEKGHVWAFEPGSAPAAYLRESIQVNKFRQLELIEIGLSNRSGSAEFYVYSNAELSGLTPPGDIAATTRQIVQVRTLDECQVEYNWPAIDFVKLDAEGEEERILQGGQAFFSTQSPLVMFELKHGDHEAVDLVGVFQALGYAIYELAPGLQLLAPEPIAGKRDAFRLNLFACKPDRAAQLAEQDLLVREAAVDLPDDDVLWSGLTALGYAREHILEWHEASSMRPESNLYQAALSVYFQAHNQPHVAAERRYGWLDRSYVRLRHAVAAVPSFPRLQSLARVAFELGLRAEAVQTLNTLTDMFMAGRSELNEPFLAVSERFDRITPGATAIRRWCLAAILEQREKLRAFSSYYTGRSGLPALKLARRLGFADDELERRLALVQGT